MSNATLVTGGAGAIGSNLVKALLGKGEEVIVIDNLDSGHEKLVPKHDKVTLIKKSILDEKALEGTFKKGIKQVFHLAANFANENSIDHPEKDLLVNGLGTLRLLMASQRHNVKRFVYASSSCVYGNIAGAVKEDAKTSLDTPYAVTKLLGEHYTRFFHEHYGVPTAIVRIFNSFGPGEMPGKYRNVIPNFLAAAMKGKPLTITGTGNETRDFNWVGNTVQGLLLAAEKEKAIGQTFNIGSGEATEITKLAEMINSITGNKAPTRLVERRKWDRVIHRKADISKAKKILGYQPEISLHKHLKLTYEWLKQNQ
ncbi:NAD-dependent epimerase/dehydratase family protein [Candidatus Woesearchaeota archaeon]|nr:NAD-dependent epimerase/dehydratase family protein [Candidatus Woesearchaeota archaeon]